MSGCANCGNPKNPGDLSRYCKPCLDALVASAQEGAARARDTANHCKCSLQVRMSVEVRRIGETCQICGKYVPVEARAEEAQAISLHARMMNVQSEERSHAGLFVVSPLAWAIKKTWNGKPKRRSS